MTASSWLGIETEASKGNMAKYPDLNKQYQDIIADLVSEYTRSAIRVSVRVTVRFSILDS